MPIFAGLVFMWLLGYKAGLVTALRKKGINVIYGIYLGIIEASLVMGLLAALLIMISKLVRY